MPQKMSATETKSQMSGAGCPPEVMSAIESKGLDIPTVWAAIQQIQGIMVDGSKTPWQKTWAIALVVLSLIPAVAP